MNFKDKQLYRSANKSTYQNTLTEKTAKHFRYTRNTKIMSGSIVKRGKMQPNNNLGYDYTPLIKFLFSRLNQNFDITFSEINLILNNGLHKPKVKTEILSMINVLVHKQVIINDNIVNDNNGNILSSFFRFGEATYYDSFYIDNDNNLKLIKDITKEIFEFCDYACHCHTHSYNGKKYINKIK